MTPSLTIPNSQREGGNQARRLRVNEPTERAADAIYIHDEDDNDIATFFHSEHATVGQSYDTALRLATLLVEENNGGAEPAVRGSESTNDEPLWCMHIAGPDDLHAAPDFWTALAWAAELNAFMAKKASEGGWAKDDNYPLTQATAVRWPWSAEGHAACLAKELAERADHEKRRAALTKPKREGVDHEFKSHPDVFWPAARGEKTFEFRKDDRGGYHVGQTVRLRCFVNGAYADAAPLDRIITNILRPGEFGLQDGYCILSLASARPSPGDPVRAALEEAVREAYREGWWVNASIPGEDGSGNQAYFDGCEEVDWTGSKARAQARTALSVSTPTGEGEEACPVEKIQEIHRRHLNRIIDDWDQHNALDEGEISFLIRMAGNYLRPFTPITLQGETAALAHPQQGGEREGWKPNILEVADVMAWEGHDYDFSLTCKWPDGSDTVEGVSKNCAKALGLDFGTIGAEEPVPAAPTSPSKSSGDEA